MGRSKALNLPATPTYETDPLFQQGSQELLSAGRGILGGDIPSWLRPTIDYDTSSSALSYAQGLLQPQFRDTIQQITNSAAGAGQLESSTFTDALARAASDVNSQYQSIVSSQAIRDRELSNQNRLGLFGQGLNAVQSATGFGQANQSQRNQFNLENYNNLVAQTIANQKQKKGGLLGGLLGAGGGAMLGLGLAPFTGGSSLLLAGLGGLGGGLAGGLSPESSNVGGNLLGVGSSLLGSSSFKSGLSAPYLTRSYDSNNPFGLIGNDYGQLYTRN